MKFLDKMKMYFTLNKAWLEELELYKTNFTLAKDPKLILLDGKIVKFNNSFLNFVEDRHIITQPNWYDFLSFDDTKIGSSYFIKLKNTITNEKVPILVSSSSYSINKKKYINITLKDLSETELAKSRLNVLMEASRYISDGVIITDTNGNIQWVNKVVLDIYGYTEEELVGKKTSIFKSNLEDPEKYEAMWKTILSNKIWTGEVVNVSKEDLIKLVKLIIIPITTDEEITNFVGIQNIKSPINFLFQENSEDRLKTLFEKINLGFFIFNTMKDKHGKIINLKLDYSNPHGKSIIKEHHLILKDILEKDKKFWCEAVHKVLDQDIINSFQLKLDDTHKVRIYNFKLNKTKIISILMLTI